MEGQGVCDYHGGKSPQAIAHAYLRTSQHHGLGLHREIHPHDAILEEVYRAAGSVAWLDDMVQSIRQEDVGFGLTTEDDKNASEFPGTDIKREAKLNVWVQLWQSERDRLAKVCKLAIDIGLDERRIKLAENQGLMVATVIRKAMQGMLEALIAQGLSAALTDAWPKLVSEVVPRELRALSPTSGQPGHAEAPSPK
jgi:hypothetical protein